MPTPAKRKVSVTLDEDLVAQIEAEGEGLSAQVNTAVRAHLTERRRRQALGQLLDRLEGEDGPLDTPEDEEEIARIMQLLGGEPDAAATVKAGASSRAAG